MKWTTYAVNSFLIGAASLQTTTVSGAFVPQGFRSPGAAGTRTTFQRTTPRQIVSLPVSSMAEYDMTDSPEIDYFYDDQDEDEEFIMDPSGMTLWEIKSEIRFLGGTYDKSCRDKRVMIKRLLEVRANPPGSSSSGGDSGSSDNNNNSMFLEESVQQEQQREEPSSSSSSNSIFLHEEEPPKRDTPMTATTSPKNPKSSKPKSTTTKGWDPSQMSAEQIQKELDTFGVDYSDCLDRFELLERWEDVRSNPGKYLGSSQKKVKKLEDVFIPPSSSSSDTTRTTPASSTYSSSSGGGQSLMGYTEHEIARKDSDSLWQETPEVFNPKPNNGNRQNDITAAGGYKPYQEYQYAKGGRGDTTGNNMFGNSIEAFKKTNIKDVQMEEMKKRNDQYNKGQPAPTFLQHDGGIMNLDQLEQESYREEKQLRKRRSSKLEDSQSNSKPSRRGQPTQPSFFDAEGPMSMEELEQQAKREERKRRQQMVQNNNSNNRQPTNGQPIFFHHEGTISLEELEQEARREQQERQRQPRNNNKRNTSNMERNMPTTAVSKDSVSPPKPKTILFQGVQVESSRRPGGAAAAAASPYREPDQSIFGNQEIKNWSYKQTQSAESTTFFNGVLVEDAPAAPATNSNSGRAAEERSRAEAEAVEAAARAAQQQQQQQDGSNNDQMQSISQEQEQQENNSTPPPPPTAANNWNMGKQNTQGGYGAPDNPFNMPTIEQPKPIAKKWDPRQGYMY